jgi:hypothetical protein
MEQTETRNTQDHKTQKRTEQPLGITDEYLGIVEYPKGQHATANDNETINQKNAPIGQRILGKIPIQYLVEWILHHLIFLKLCKGTNKSPKRKTIPRFFSQCHAGDRTAVTFPPNVTAVPVPSVT